MSSIWAVTSSIARRGYACWVDRTRSVRMASMIWESTEPASCWRTLSTFGAALADAVAVIAIDVPGGSITVAAGARYFLLFTIGPFVFRGAGVRPRYASP